LGLVQQDGGPCHDGYMVVGMGDNPGFAAELIELMLAGTKRATASLVRDFEAAGEPTPKPGDYALVVDANGNPRCIWRTTEITIKPLIAVDDAFAWDEGEGDRTRASWLAGHRRHFTRQALREDFTMQDPIATVFERFTLVWPPEAADPAE
jgi:uncharacterized protein YhfF